MKFASIVLTIVLIFLTSCAGGGSEGTGTRMVTGLVITKSSAPVTQASVTILETGDSGTTDDAGKFSIQTSSISGNLTLEIVKQDLTVTATVPDVEADATSVNVSVTVDTDNASATVSDIHIWARIVGACDIYFENRDVIRQSNKVPTSGVNCTAKVFASGNGKRLQNIPVGMEVRACDESRWRKIAEGRIGTGANAGVGQVNFKFLDNQRNCEYRIAAPYQVDGVEPLHIYLATLTLQNM